MTNDGSAVFTFRTSCFVIRFDSSFGFRHSDSPSPVPPPPRYNIPMPFLNYGRGSRGRGFNPRILIALVIAVMAIVGYLGKKSINPVTGEKQYVDLSPNQEI